MKIIGFLVIIVAAIAALPLLGCRQRGPEHLIKRIFKDMAEELNLSEEQTATLFNARDEIIERGREMHGEREQMHKYLSGLILSDKIDVQEVKAEAKRKHDKMEAFMEFNIDEFAKFHATLTPEQKKTLARLFEKHSRRMKRMHP